RSAGDPQRSRDERAEAEERRVAEVHLPRVAGHDVPRLGERDGQQDEEDEIEQIVARPGQRQECQEPERRENGQGPAALVPGRRHRFSWGAPTWPPGIFSEGANAPSDSPANARRAPGNPGPSWVTRAVIGRTVPADARRARRRR